ncbi:MAG: ATP-binding protein, partial [Bacillus sp. (in: firmicutes)]
ISDQIFQKGFSTKNRQSNAGIGLSLVKEAIRGLGGYITFSSNEGEGTIFTVAIPKSRGYLNEAKTQYRSVNC